MVAGASPEMSRAVIANWLSRNRNPTVGRQLAGLLARSGLLEAHLEGHAVCYRSLDEADRVFPLRRAARQAPADSVITEVDASRWISDLERSSSNGSFVLSITLFTAVASKPQQKDGQATMGASVPSPGAP